MTEGVAGARGARTPLVVLRPGLRSSAVPGLVAVVLAAGLLTGCTSNEPAAGTGRPVPPPAPGGAGTLGAAATTTPGAELRAGLTWQLVERVHLLALARAALLASPLGRDAPAVRSAESLLEATAVDLAATVGAGGGDLVALLRGEVEAVLAPQVDPAALTAVHERTAGLLLAVAPALPRAELVAQLDRATRGLGQVPARPDPTGAAVAAGLVANALAAERGDGSTETPAVVLRADLVRLLVDRAYTVGAAPDSAALARLTTALGARLAGAGARSGVETALRAGHTALFAVAEARVAGDGTGTARAREALQAADRDLAGRLGAAVPALPAPLVLAELDPARGPLVAAVRARAAGSPDAAALSSAYARRALVTAAVLAAGLAEQTRMG